MLQTLYIQNYALIDEVDISFSSGFSVITGETGAGKSIILGAIGLLLGQRSDAKSIRKDASKCVIEATFDVEGYDIKHLFDEVGVDYEKECIIRREVHSSGKSRAFINDSPVSLSDLKTIGERLIDIHSQHQNLLLSKENFQIEVLDIISHNQELLAEYKTAYHKWKEAESKLRKAKEELEKDKDEEDYIRFQVEQLSDAKLEENEQEELEKEVELLSNSEEIKTALYAADSVFYSDNGGILSSIKEGMSALKNISGVYSEVEELVERMESAYIELKDISKEVSNRAENIESNPERLQIVNERLDLIYSLQKKHKVDTVEELIEIYKLLKDKLNNIENNDEYIRELERISFETKQCLLDKSSKLTLERKNISSDLERELPKRLSLLGMPNVRFCVEFTEKKDPSPDGMDSISFMFSANKNSAMQSISTVASGGEIARVMLTIKSMIAAETKLPTIIFDEIDTGVSGDIADRMADVMKEMGRENRQVISITHLPQIAAKGNNHYKVYKKDNDVETNSHIRRLEEEERATEIAYMLSGSTMTEAAMKNAEELLKEGRK